ncbi:MAG: sensor histidine kinase [Actinomycetota bacterium]|nr:sensor histidine kinase [Actinomycetota bacterium]
MGGGALGSVDTDQSGGSLTHQALLYGSEEEFLTVTVPFIRDGLDRGDPIRVAATGRNTRWLQAALGVDTPHVAFFDSSQWYRHPVRTLAALHHTVQAAASGGQLLRMIEDPMCTARTRQESKEWARYESLVNAALARANAALVCTYDTRLVESDVVTEVARTHPELVINGDSQPSRSYVDPAVFNAESDRLPLPPAPPSALRLKFDGVGQLSTLRGFVISYVTWAGAAVHAAERFVQAVDEVATNAIDHGGGSALLRVWTDPQWISCEVSDTGAGLRDPLAGRLPTGFTARGRGLWLARQFCDLVELHSDPAGTTVRLHLALP